MKYDFTQIETKWQKYWLDQKVYKSEISTDKPKFYALIEFPFPSGVGLHVGHARPYTALECPPLVYGCPFIGFTSSKSDLELISRRVIRDFEGVGR